MAKNHNNTQKAANKNTNAANCGKNATEWNDTTNCKDTTKNSTKNSAHDTADDCSDRY